MEGGHLALLLKFASSFNMNHLASDPKQATQFV